MAITILNPARFNDDGGLGTRRFVRAAFFDEGYGVSNRLSAYAQGAGIVPATAAFNQIGAGTVGDPLRLSQFSNFTVPSLGAILTTGSNFINFPGGKGVAYYDLGSYGFTPGGTFVDVPDAFYSLSYPAFGSVSGQVTGSTGTTHTVVECIYHFFTNETPLFNKQLIITVNGNLTNKTYTPYINGAAIAGAKTGSYNGSTTTFRWNEGTTNTGSTIPGNDTTTPDTNPFGNNGTTPILQML